MKRTLVALALLPLLAPLAACSGGGSSEKFPRAGATATVTVTATVTASPTEDATEDALADLPLEAGSFMLEAKVKDKECFGSAGCNVTVEIIPTVLDLSMLEEYSAIELTYKLTGGEDGPLVGTIEFDSEGSYSKQEELVSVANSGVKLKATPTDVSAY